MMHQIQILKQTSNFTKFYKCFFSVQNYLKNGLIIVYWYQRKLCCKIFIIFWKNSKLLLNLKKTLTKSYLFYRSHHISSSNNLINASRKTLALIRALHIFSQVSTERYFFVIWDQFFFNVGLQPDIYMCTKKKFGCFDLKPEDPF